MHRATKLSATVMMGLALAVAPTWVNAADEKKSTTESVKTNVSDSWITSKTKIALYADNRVPGTDVNVETQKGTVFLRGKVDSDAAKAAAEEIAKGIDGVKSVKNELQVVAKADKKMVEAKDEDLTKQVKTRLQSDARLKKVDVRVDNGVVTLQGKVASIADSARASQLARGVPGVRAVKNDMTFDSAMDDPSTMRNRLGRTKDTMKDKMTTMTDGSDKVTGSQTHVAAAQQALQKEGFNPGPIDGYVGPRTAAAVREFQQKEQLQVTGQLDPETLGRLGIGVGGATRKPQTP
jgi:hyperosmotically inducible periplasmic protein